jgi:hypothetical protein
VNFTAFESRFSVDLLQLALIALHDPHSGGGIE